MTFLFHSNDRVSRKAEELLRKKASGVNLEDSVLVGKLFSIFQGMTSQHCSNLDFPLQDWTCS
jgi:hypothetical protein